MVGQQFWLFCGTGNNQWGRNDWNFDVKMAGFSTMTMLLCSQRCPSRSFSWRPRLQCWKSYPTAWSLVIGSTAFLQLDLSPLVLQPAYCLICLLWFSSNPTPLIPLVPQPTYCLISHLWFSSNPTPLISSGFTGTLQSDLSSVVTANLQPDLSAANFFWFRNGDVV